MIVEGQADYLVVHALARALGYDLDEHGVSVIDAQNNGNPDTFAALARALSIPWLAVFDGDDAGQGYVQAIARRGFTETDVAQRCHTHQADDLEAQFVDDGLGPELREILVELGYRDAPGLTDEDLLERLRSNKTPCAAALAARLQTDQALAQRAPGAFRTAIAQLPELG